MANIARYGDGNDAKIMDAQVGDGDPLPAFVMSDPHDMRPFNVTSAVLIAGGIPEQVMVVADDAVDGATMTWTLDDFDFTGFDGGFLIVEGAENPENNNVFPIDTGADGSVTTELPRDGVGPVDEEFDLSNVLIYAVPPTDLEGTWKVELSNDYVPPGGGTSYGQPPNRGQWTDITSQFSPTIQAVDGSSAATLSQFVQAELSARTIQYSFTRSAGGADGARVQVIAFSKSNG